jgi:hypothetical protein
MPKQSKKSEGNGKGKGKKAEKAHAGADDEFDNMLVELRAADLTAEAAISSSSSSHNSSSTSTSSPSNAYNASEAEAEKVSEVALFQACVRGDISQLRRWARRGVRVTPVRSRYATWYSMKITRWCGVWSENLGLTSTDLAKTVQHPCALRPGRAI